MDTIPRYPDPMAALDAAIAAMGTDGKPGTMAALAKAIGSGVGQSHVSMWKTRKSVPAKYAPAIERATGRRVLCEDLCPDVDWSVVRSPLVSATGAQQDGAGGPGTGATEESAAAVADGSAAAQSAREVGEAA